MEVIAAGLSWALSNSTWLAGWGLGSAPNDQGRIIKELGTRLSPGASIHLPDSPNFFEVTQRWTNKPSFFASVEVTTERDVELTIQYANEHHIPFLAQSGGHGIWQGISDLQDGIQIFMRELNSISFNDQNGGQTAILGGGVLGSELIPALHAAGKQAVYGLCTCVSPLGAALGGGHGVLQGHYGYMADNIVSARVVLANGTTITVSEDSHSDLFWGLRGAGHNFGIVTSYEYKVYDIPEDDQYTLTNFIFTQDKLEQVFETANQFIGSEANPPRELLLWCTIIMDPYIDPDKPILNLLVQYQGSSTQALPYTTPFSALGPASTTTQTVTSYSELHIAMGFPDDTLGCQKGLYDLHFSTLSLIRFNSTAMRTYYDTLLEAQNTHGLNVFVMVEVYASNKAKEIPAESNAVSPEERRSNILVGGMLSWPPSPPDPAKARIASQSGKRLVQALRDGIDVKRDGQPGAYVNYANGEQTLEELYGYEPWRLERLRGLKERYDPERRFRWYAPL